MLTLLGSLFTLAWVPRRWRPLALPTMLLGAAAAALAIDCPLARWCIDDNCPGLLGELFGAAKVFGDGFGVMLIGLAIYTLDPVRRWAIGRVMVMSLGAGLAADVVKLLIGRVRPRYFDFQGGVTDTFGEWLPLLGDGAGGQSFPSAHTATAVGMAVALAWLYPRGRWLFALLVVLVACQRVEVKAHYLSDTLAGAAVGWLVATACIQNAWLAGGFDRLERFYPSRRRWAAQSRQAVPSEQLTVESAASDDHSRAA
jgi:membrane-associated phospholipid phosphatase